MRKYPCEAAEREHFARVESLNVLLKAIKAILQKTTQHLPPKSHDLLLLLRKANVALPADLQTFIGQLSGLSIPTRYPDDLRVAVGTFHRRFAEHCITMTAKVFRWFEQAVR